MVIKVFTITVGDGGGQGGDTSIVNSAGTFDQTSLMVDHLVVMMVLLLERWYLRNAIPGGDGTAGQGNNGGESQRCNNCLTWWRHGAGCSGRLLEPVLSGQVLTPVTGWFNWCNF